MFSCYTLFFIVVVSVSRCRFSCYYSPLLVALVCMCVCVWGGGRAWGCGGSVCMHGRCVCVCGCLCTRGVCVCVRTRARTKLIFSRSLASFRCTNPSYFFFIFQFAEDVFFYDSHSVCLLKTFLSFILESEKWLLFLSLIHI